MYRFLQEEDGAATLEIAIITMALVAVALLFKEQIIEMCKAVADKILG
jgi:Flp pilus assembly pilin Flp